MSMKEETRPSSPVITSSTQITPKDENPGNTNKRIFFSLIPPTDCPKDVPKSKRQKSEIDKNDYICIHVSGHGSTPEYANCTTQTIYDSIHHLINKKKGVLGDNSSIDTTGIVNSLFNAEYTKNVYTSNAVACGMSNLMMEGQEDGNQSLDSTLLKELYEVYNPKGCREAVTDEEEFKDLFFDARMNMRKTHINQLDAVLNNTISAYNSEVDNCNRNNSGDKLQRIKNIKLGYTLPTRIAKQIRGCGFEYVNQMSGNYLVNELNRILQQEKVIMHSNNTKSLEKGCSKLREIESVLDMQALIYVTLNDLPSEKVYNANTITTKTTDFFFDINKPVGESDNFDAIYGLNIVYMKLMGKRKTIPRPNTRSNVKKTEILTGDKYQDVSYRNTPITSNDKIDLIAHADMLSNNEDPLTKLKQSCLVEILGKLNTGKIYYSDLYLLFRWCLGIKHIAFFFPACRTCTKGFSVTMLPKEGVRTPRGEGGKRTAGKQTRKKRKTKRKKSAVKSKKRVNGVKKAMKRGSSKKKR